MVDWLFKIDFMPGNNLCFVYFPPQQNNESIYFNGLSTLYDHIPNSGDSPSYPHIPL